MENKRPSIIVWLAPILSTLAVASALMVAGRLGDVFLLSDGPATVFKGWLFVKDPVIAREVILAVLEVLAAIFAISITVVAIIVQLAATRYTSRVVDLFLADPLNMLIFFAYLVPLVYGFWLANTLTKGENPAVSVAVFMVMATLSITLIAPYFKFVFHFLQPSPSAMGCGKARDCWPDSSSGANNPNGSSASLTPWRARSAKCSPPCAPNCSLPKTASSGKSKTGANRFTSWKKNTASRSICSSPGCWANPLRPVKSPKAPEWKFSAGINGLVFFAGRWNGVASIGVKRMKVDFFVQEG